MAKPEIGQQLRAQTHGTQPKVRCPWPADVPLKYQPGSKTGEGDEGYPKEEDPLPQTGQAGNRAGGGQTTQDERAQISDDGWQVRWKKPGPQEGEAPGGAEIESPAQHKPESQKNTRGNVQREPMKICEPQGRQTVVELEGYRENEAHMQDLGPARIRRAIATIHNIF